MDAVQLSHSSAVISIQPTNATEFVQRQKLIFDIEPDIAFVRGRESYVVFDVLNTSADKNRWMFQTSAQSLIEQIDFFSGSSSGGLNLESLLQYGQVAGIQTPYEVNDTTPLEMKEGQRVPIEMKHVTSLGGAEIDQLISCGTDDLAAVNGQVSPIATDGTAKYTSRRFCIPLHSGLFSRWWDMEERLCPVGMFGGLRIEITFAEVSKVCAQIATEQSGSPVQVPTVSTAPLGGTTFKLAGVPTVDATGLAIGNKLTLGDATTGFVTGVSAPGGTNTGYSDGAQTGIATTGGSAGPPPASGLTVDFTVAGGIVQSPITINAAGANYQVGDVITINGAGGSNCTFTITSVAPVTQDVTVSGITADGTDATITCDTLTVSQPTTMTLKTRTRDAGDGLLGYKVTRAELRCMQIALPDKQTQALLGKGMKYGFTSYDHFLDTVLTSSQKTVVDIPTVASKAKAIQSVLVDTSKEDDAYVSSYYATAPPSSSKLNSVASYIENKLYPLIPYDPSVKRDRCIALNELVKSFSSIGKVTESLGSSDKHNLDGYTNPFIYGRQLAEGDFVVNLREAEPQLRLGFSGTRTHPFRSHTYVFSTKVLMSSSAGLQLEL